MSTSKSKSKSLWSWSPERVTRLLPARVRDRLDEYLEALSVFFEVRDPKVLSALGPSGIRGLLLKRGKQGVPTMMPASHRAHFDWQYPDDQPEMRALFVRADPVALRHGQAHFVQPVEQAVLAKRIHAKAKRFTVWTNHLLCGEINGELVVGRRGFFLKQHIDLLSSQNDWQHAVFKTVVKENIGKTWCNNGTKTIFIQCPRCMLTA